MDTNTQVLVQALKAALSQPGEHRLFRAGKFPGMFASRFGANGEAAAQALRDGMVEIIRTETKGKTITEWVLVTPRGIEFVHQYESPLQALRDLQAALRLNQQGIPGWVAELRQELQAFGERLSTQAQKVSERIDALSQQVAEALGRAEAGQPRVPADLASLIPWGAQALEYLNQRKTAAMPELCPLPELFAALLDKCAELTLADFHSGLRRLYDRGVLRLVPYEGTEALREPEYALLDGAATFYHVARQ
jgi:hypothetical protein